MTLAIETRKLSKSYGNVRGIVDIDLEVGAGEVFGLLGPNGAGKTTTIRVLLDFIRPTSGDALVLGLDCRRDSVQVRQRVGYLPGELATYERMTGSEMFTYIANLKGRRGGAGFAQLAERLSFDLSRRLGDLSKGNRQKAGIIAAFMGDPDLVLLDEPTAGLDPLVQEEVHGLVEEASRGGRTVFLSSHVLSEVEHLCGRVAVIREGALVAVEAVDALKARAFRRLEIVFDGPVPLAAFSGLPGVTDVSVREGRMACVVVGPLDSVIKAASRYRVLDVKSEQASLEEVFLGYYSGSAGNATRTATGAPSAP